MKGLVERTTSVISDGEIHRVNYQVYIVVQEKVQGHKGWPMTGDLAVSHPREVAGIMGKGMITEGEGLITEGEWLITSEGEGLITHHEQKHNFIIYWKREHKYMNTF